MPIIVYIYLALQLLIVAYFDIQTRKIINWWPISNVLIYVMLVFLYPKYYAFSFQTFIWPIGFFVAGFLLFVLKIMGGGDSKYLASFYLMVPLQLHEETFISLAVATSLIAGSIFVKNILTNTDKLLIAWREKNIFYIKTLFGKKFAFAPVIFISWIWLGWKIRKIFVF